MCSVLYALGELAAAACEIETKGKEETLGIKRLKFDVQTWNEAAVGKARDLSDRTRAVADGKMLINGRRVAVGYERLQSEQICIMQC
jgi:hypothetical protein